MGNSLPTVPTEEIAPATEQSGGTTDVPTVILPEREQSGGTTDVPTVILPEAGGVALGQGPVEQEPSENEADSVLGTSPSYADHAEAQDVRDVKRPRRGIPAGSRARVGAVPTPNESEEDLLKQVFQRELEVRRQEGEALGLHLRAEADEPLPLLSHFYGPPSPSEMYDSLALCLTDRSFLTRVALGGGGRSQDLVGGATGVSGKGRVSRPEKYGEETPYVPPRPPRFPEEEQQRPQQKLLIDQATITDNALEEWHAWLKLAQQGRSLREWGLISSDVITAVEYLGEAPPQEEPARGGRWTNAPRGGGRKKQKPQQEYPTSVGTLLYLKKALKCIDCFGRWITQWVPRIGAGTIGCNGVGEARRGHGLGRTRGMEVFGGFGRPQSPATLGQKESEEPHGGCYDGYLVADPESSSRAASAAADADHACRGQLGLLFGGCVRSFGRVPVRGGGRSRVDRYPPLPWYRNAVAARGHHPGVWNTGVAASAVSRGWCCSSFGRKECRRRLLFEPSGRNSSGHTGDGTAHAGGNRTEEPGEPGISYLPAGEAGGKDAFGVGWFDGTIVFRGTTSTCFATTSTAAIEEPVCAAPARSFGAIKRANATGKGVYSPLAFGRSIFRAFGRHRFRNRNPIRRLRERGRGRESGYGERQSRFVNSFDLWFLKKKKTFGEHVWHEGFEWHVLGMELGMNVSLICACFGSLGNPEAPQSLQALTLFPSLLCLPFSRVRTPAMFIDVVAATLFAGLLFAWSLLSGIAFWWCSLVLQLFRKLLRRRGLRTKRFRAKCRRKESCFRVKCQGRWVRVWTQRQLVVVRREKVGCSLLLESMLRKCRLFWHVFLGMFGMFGMLVHVCERGYDEQPRPGKAEVSEHRLRALHRGLPLPGAGTSADPLNLDPVDPYDPEGLLEPPAGLPEGRRPPPQPERIIDPSGDPEDPGDETTDLRVPLSSFSLHRHRCNGHFPFDENCTACCSSKGRVPARRLRRKLQRENQTVGLDFFYFGKLRVLLVMHLGSRYTLCLPAPELSDDLAFNLTRALKECGLSGKAVTFRLDNEASLVALVERTARHRACTASAVITDVVPGYRPQSKGSIEKQVDIMKSGFWAIWLDLEAQINEAQPSSDATEGIKLPLGGLLWQACIFYTARCFNLWSTGPGNSSVSLDRLHEEYVQKSRTRAFGSVCQARVARSKAHLQRYRGARTVKIVYLGPVHARGGGVYGVPLNGKDIDVFPAIAVGKEETTIDVPTLLGLASEKPLALDDQDPERPTLFEPAEREEEGEGFPSEGVDADGDEEMIQDDEGLGDYSPSLPPSDGEAQEVIDNEGDMEVDMSIDWLTSHLLERVFQGPELRASSSEVPVLYPEVWW